MQVKSRTKNPKAIWQLSRLMAGASDVDRELIKAEWPDIPLNGTSPNYEGLRAWIMARPELADAVARIDPEEPPPDPPHRRGWKVADLMATEFPAPRWAVPELVPEGLSFLAGRPKMGKSWMALQLAHAVGTGGRFLNVVAERGPVLFYALEDGKSRIKDRVQRQGWDTDAAEVMFRFNLLDLATPEGLTQLQADIDKEDYKLVVIDTLSRAAKYKQLDIAESTDVVGELQKLAITQHRAVVLIDHYRKRNAMARDVIDDLLGSTGKAATADAILGLYRERGKHNAVLSISGRELGERNLSIEWNTLTYSWKYLGDADRMELTRRRQEVLNAVQSLGRASLKEIAETVGQDKSNTNKRLQDLVGMGRLVRIVDEKERVLYELPPSKEKH